MRKLHRTLATSLAPVLLAGFSIAVAAPAAHATDYSGYQIGQLQSLCLAQGEEIGPDGTQFGYIPSTQVEYGSTGVCVAAVQAIIDAGSSWCATGKGTQSSELAWDGQDGPLTDAAVRCVQQLRKLDVDGQVGPQTWTAIWHSY